MFLKQQKSQTNSNSQQILLADPTFFLFLFLISIFISPSLSDISTPLLASLPVAVFLSFLSLSYSLSLHLNVQLSSQQHFTPAEIHV